MSSKKYCRLCRKKETREQCSYGPKLYDKYSVDDATEKETADAAVESGISENDIKNFSNIIIEKSKSGDSSLRDWFSKSRSSDGKPGWVQLGGKYAGKPCARQPGQTTKPKCGSSKMKRNLNKDEEDAAFRRKNAQDPNPDRKGKAINVDTEKKKKKVSEEQLGEYYGMHGGMGNSTSKKLRDDEEYLKRKSKVDRLLAAVRRGREKNKQQTK